jgi:predicted DNA-binding protein (UPF0251 family)
MIVELCESYREPVNELEEAVRLVCCLHYTLQEAANEMHVAKWEVRALLLEAGQKVPKF